MASVQISGVEFTAVASAAAEALKRGDRDEAFILDRLARKIAASIELRRNGRGLRYKGDHPNVPFPWQDMPRTINEQNPLETE